MPLEIVKRSITIRSIWNTDNRFLKQVSGGLPVGCVSTDSSHVEVVQTV